MKSFHLGLSAIVLGAVLASCSSEGGETETGEAGAGGGAGSAGSVGSPGSAGTGGSTGSAGSGPAGAPGRGGASAVAGSGGSAGSVGSPGVAGAGPAGASGGGSTGVAGGSAGATGAAGSGPAGSGGRGGTVGTAGSGPAGASGRGGAGGTAGAAQAGSTGHAICNFASGLNIAWVNFANDVPNPNMTTFNTIFTQTYDAGGRVIRWWFHTNGTKTPGYDSTGKVVPIPQSHKDGIKQILDGAASHGVQIVISLWSFDMLQDNAGTAHTNNSRLLEDDTIRQSYIDNYLTPLVTFTKGHPGLYAYEIFNEPEGMSPKGWATYRTTQAAIQKTVNWFVDAIRAADPDVFVTTSAQTFDYCSKGVSGKDNWYSDSALRSVGGRQNGVLDFYQVHYYTVNGTSNSAFMNPASHWGLDKKLVMGEFYAQDTESIARGNLYTKLYDTGYNGAWGWQYNDGDAAVKWPTMQLPMQNVYTAHMADVGSCKR